MKITFIGAMHEVTGSASLLQTGNLNILVDYGMEQGANHFENVPLAVEAKDIDFILLTHAHIDHSGRIPLLYKQGFRGKIYCTEETKKLCSIMLMDYAHMKADDIECENRKNKRAGNAQMEPIYTTEDTKGALSLFYGCDYDEIVNISPEISVRFINAYHLLGSSSIEIWLREKNSERKLVFSGDLGNTSLYTIENRSHITKADYLMIESTYGDRLHDGAKWQDNIKFLADVIQSTFDKGGNVVVPSFAVGRTQEMLYFIRQIKHEGLVSGHDGFEVYLDSPLALESTEIFANCCTDSLNDETKKLVNEGINPIMFEGLHLARTTEESKAINYSKEPKVIIASSGMCNEGRVKHHLKHNLWRCESTILFARSQVKDTLGYELCNGAKQVKIYNETIAVKAQIVKMPSVSGHADKNELIQWLDFLQEAPKMVFVNHGEDSVCTSFAKSISDKYGYNAVAPYSGCVYDLINNCYINKAKGVKIKYSSGEGRQGNGFSELKSAVDTLSKSLERAKNYSSKLIEKYIKIVNDLIKEIREGN